MTDPIERYRQLSEERTRIMPDMLAEIVRRYSVEKESVISLSEAVGVSHLTVYRWLHDSGVSVARRGRKRQISQPPPTAKRPVSLEPHFEWAPDATNERVLVTVGTREVIVDRDRLWWSDGDAELGQNLVSGKNLELVEKFERFVNEND